MYEPMIVAGLARRLSCESDVKVRWKLVWEFFEGYFSTSLTLVQRMMLELNNP
jgi:hypothetical protein